MSSEIQTPTVIGLNLAQVKNAILRSDVAQPVCLIAVSKTHTAQAVALAAQTGHLDFGENYVQEAIEKIQFLKSSHPHLIWHLIGPLQSNKTKTVAEHFDWVHTVDRLKIAHRLNEQRPITLAPLNVLIQVNIDHEDTKSGVDPDAVLDLALAIKPLTRLRLRGLMCIPALNSTAAFVRMQQLMHTLNQNGLQLDCLSMGMSNDYLEAIAHGATHIRVGTAIFGQRATPH